MDPNKLMTDRNGRNARVRVDPGQTSFFTGKEFRTFKELNIPNGQKYIIRVTVPLNIIVHSFDIAIDQGQLRVTTMAGGTPSGGTFSEVLPIIRKNEMTEVPQPAHVAQVVIDAIPPSATAAHAGGVQRDVQRLVAPNGQSVTVAVVGGEDSERGIPGGTVFYQIFENLGANAVLGTVHAHYEERP